MRPSHRREVRRGGTAAAARGLPRNRSRRRRSIVAPSRVGGTSAASRMPSGTRVGEGRRPGRMGEGVGSQGTLARHKAANKKTDGDRLRRIRSFTLYHGSFMIRGYERPVWQDEVGRGRVEVRRQGGHVSVSD